MVIKGDILDLTDLQRRGILKKEPERERIGVKYSSDGFVDLSHLKKSKDVSNFEESDYDNSGGTGKRDLLSSIFGGAGGSGSSNGGSFWDAGTNNNSAESTLSADGSDASNSFGFLDSSSPGSSSGEGDTYSSSDGGSYFNNSEKNVDLLELHGLKNKIEDLEYKINSLMDKIAKLESVK